MADAWMDVYKGKKILVTGHTGFKGSWLCVWLQSLGAQVVGYSLKPPSQPNMFDALGLQKKIEHICGDVRDLDFMIQTLAMFKPDMVFHLAAQALVRPSYEQPVVTYSTNVMGTVNVLEAIRQTDGVLAAVVVTSDKCYENCEEGGAFEEYQPMGGYDPYSSSKGCAELVVSAYRRSFFSSSEQTSHIASVRAGNVIGGGDWGLDRIVPDCVRALSAGEPIIVRNPRAVRPWQHVLEPLYGYLLLGARMLTRSKQFAQAWNFGPDTQSIITVEDLVGQIISAWGEGSFEVAAGQKEHEATCLRLDSSKAREQLGWKQKWAVDAAIAKAIEWYKLFYSDAAQAELMDFSLQQIAEYEDTSR